ncbi:hypothetical protein HD554DRAFT_2192361 [Boletus coccyginus]|nr:hypothetical protein HD554DRAFT_2192361 [Boletus coccyginus]
MSEHDACEASPREVEVDQRALVNILARYPGPFDVLRELIQNADDAEAPSIEVHFQTGEVEKTRPAGEFDVSKLNVCKWIIKNQGSFEKKDWERLGRIAAGNDDSTKVGAFGVGFYSVLSKSDRPLVKSNGKSLQFCRAENGKLCKWFTNCSPDSWTSVELELRKPEPLPVLPDLTRFLVSSVTMLTNIHTVSIYLDGERFLHIQKESCESPVDVPIPQHLVRTTPLQALTVESVQHTVQRIKIDAAEWAFASSSTTSLPPIDIADTLVERSGRSAEDHPAPTSRSVEVILQENAITHDLYTATTCVNLLLDSEMKKGVESSMKSLPSSFKCKAVYFNSEQHDPLVRTNTSHLNKAKHLACLFSEPHSIVPGNESGRLFIGQSTNQTTGIGLHISAHFLPTMERSSIDLANGQVAAWNNEVLWVGGFLARIIYEEEMRIARSKDKLATRLGLCTMARFAFGSTVPHSGVSQILQDAFFSCCHEPKSPLPVVSDDGISCASDSQFRQGNKDLSFLKRYRILHEEVHARQNSEIIDRYKIPMFKFGDIIREFETGVPPDTMKAFFGWWEHARKSEPSSREAKDARAKFCKEFPSRGVIVSNLGVKIALKNIKYFTFFPLPGDLSPPDNIYIEATPAGVPTRDAVECFGWVQLSLLGWLKYACAQTRQFPLNRDLDVGLRVSRVLVQFALVEDLTPHQWNEAADLMEDIKCIPTSMGLKLPAESYFDQADICRNLPVAKEDDFVNIPATHVADRGGSRYMLVSLEHVQKVLLRLRVRPIMEWKDMVERLETAASEDSNDRFLRYLVFIYQGRLADHQINELKKKKVFYSKNHGRVSATELHFPNEDIRKLGLPILARNSITSLQSAVDLPSSFPVEPFIESLGIQRYPTLNKIIELAASDEREIQRSALQYLLSNLETIYNAYKPEDFANIAFIPTKSGSLARPNEVFASPVWERLGFKQASETLRRDLSRLGVKDDPSVETIIEYFKTPERTLPDLDTAAIWFEHLYLYGKLPIPKLREQLSIIPFVPVKSPKHSSSEPSPEPSSPIEYFPPNECFITSPDTKEHEHYRSIFPFVDFRQNANSFLESCCAKKSPDASDIARKIVKNPQGYLNALGNDTNLYLEDLRTIASRLDSISEDDKKAMQEAPMFLAFRQRGNGGKLLSAHQVVIGDWESRDFGGNVYLAPKDSTIEKMYHKMGSEFLGTYVQHHINPAGSNRKYNPPFSDGQIIRRIRCFLRQRDKSEKTDVSFYSEDSTVKLVVKACKSLTMKKTFAPPFGVLADGENVRVRETKPVQVKAGFESDKSYTLLVVDGSPESADLRNDIAVALCRVLLKTFGPNDVLLLASLLAMDDKSLEGYYGSETKPDLPPSAPDAKVESKKKVRLEFPVPSHLARPLGALIPKFLRVRIANQKTIPPEEDMQKAIGLWGRLDSDGQPPDFGAPCRPNPIDFKKHNSHCKQAHTTMLKEREDLQDERTQIKFFLAQDALCQQPPQPAIQAFGKLISELTLVFGQEASKACYIFWKDTDEDLMAFNRDQKYIFFNLAHHYRFFYNKGVEEKKVVTEWFLIMAHEIAHNVTLDHDEYHGSLSSRIAITYLPALHKHFKCFTGNV